MGKILQSVVLVVVGFMSWPTEGHEYGLSAINGKLCMKMDMTTLMFHPFYSTSTWMPADAEIISNYTDCPADTAIFEAKWTDQGYIWRFNLRFENVEAKYSLQRFSGIVTDENGKGARNWTYWESTYPKAPIGKYVFCDVLITARTKFYNYKWQPFVQGAGGDYGADGKECENGLNGAQIFGVIFVLLFGIFSLLFLLIITNAGN